MACVKTAIASGKTVGVNFENLIPVSVTVPPPRFWASMFGVLNATIPTLNGTFKAHTDGSVVWAERAD